MSQSTEETAGSLLSQICHLHHSRVRQLLGALGLHRGQPQVLRTLWEREGLTQSEIAERLQKAAATVTKMLQRMEKAGFIRREPDVEDQRISRVYLTDVGHAVQTEVRAVLDTIDAEVIAGFTVEERVLLGRLLLQMRENLLYAATRKPLP
jgi:DNA-binding MarR family transcriptional regulator